MSIPERLSYILRVIFPYGLCAVLFVLELVSVPYPFSVILDAPYFLMAIYYWSVYRPTLFPPFLVFALGLLMDILGAGPLGLHAALFLVTRLVIGDQRRFFMAQSFLMFWLGFVFVNAVYFIVQWMVFSILAFHFLPLEDLFFGVILGSVIFPLICLLLHVPHKLLPDYSSHGSGLVAQRKPLW